MVRPASAKSEAADTAELLKAQHQELQSILAKRSEANADQRAIVKAFAAAWLPHTDRRTRDPYASVKSAGVDDEKIAAIAIHKDIMNWLLADLLSGRRAVGFAQAKLEALAKQFDAHRGRARTAEDHGLLAIVSSAEEANPGLNAQMKERYDRVKSRFAKWTKASERQSVCWRRGASPYPQAAGKIEGSMR